MSATSARVPKNSSLNLDRGNILASPDGQVFESIHNREAAVGLDNGNITSGKPSISRSRSLPIASNNGRSTRQQLPRLTCW